MKRKDLIRVKIEDIRFPFKGIGYIDGKEIHVKNSLPGQIVEARVKRKKKEYVEAKFVQLIENSDIETTSFCDHFGKCGGCSFQTLSYENQVELKSNMMKKLIDNAGLKDFSYKGIIHSPKIYEYRNKMEFSFGDEEKDGELRLGMHKKGRMHDVVNVFNCQICDNDFRLISEKILAFCIENNIPKYNKRIHKGVLRHLTIRKGFYTGEILIGLSASTQMEFPDDDFVQMLLDLDLEGHIVGILRLKNDGLGDAVQGEVLTLYGRDYYYEKLMDFQFKVSFFSFFQTNTKGAELLYSTAIDMMEDVDSKVVYDLFSGTGTIGQIVSRNAKKVIGIELIEDAVKSANENVKINNITNAEFICGDVFDKLDDVKVKPDIIILDPPRMGILEKTLDKIIKYKVNNIIYISCNPKTLMENLVYLEKNGYKLKELVGVDTFAHTNHLECIVSLQRKIK